MPAQVPLPFAFHKTQNFQTFWSAPNRQAVETLKDFCGSPQEPLIYLWGETGQGKTHLLQACCLQAGLEHRSVMYLPMRELVSMNPEFLVGLEHCSLICIDDVDRIAGIPEWEFGLFVFFNRHRDRGGHLLLSASTPPANLTIALPDLATRLGWGLTIRLNNLSDDDKLPALSLRARTLGFELPENVGHYLLTRYSRDMPFLWKLLDELEQATLSEQRKLTIPFIRNHLRRTSGPCNSGPEL